MFIFLSFVTACIVMFVISCLSLFTGGGNLPVWDGPSDEGDKTKVRNSSCWRLYLIQMNINFKSFFSWISLTWWPLPPSVINELYLVINCVSCDSQEVPLPDCTDARRWGALCERTMQTDTRRNSSFLQGTDDDLFLCADSSHPSSPGASSNPGGEIGPAFTGKRKCDKEDIPP